MAEEVKKDKTKVKEPSQEATSQAAKDSGAPEKKTNQSVVIAVLATALGCFVLVFGVLLATGVIKFNSSTAPGDPGWGTTEQNGKSNRPAEGGSTAQNNIIKNPNKKVTVKNSTLATVKDLEFYLPDDFEAGGKNDDGAYTYNLVDDDGWAQVLVYAEKSNLTPEKFLMKISPYLDITDTNYVMNGTNWVVGENANALAYATELDGMVYAVYYSVKLDSDATAEAMQMIPKTLYMQRIHAE